MKKILLSFTIVLLGTSLMAQNAANLKLNLEKNKVYRFKSTSEQTVSQTVNGVQQTTNAKTNSTSSIKMVDATPDFLIAEVRFDTLITNTNAMGKIVIINSTSEGNIKSTEMADVMSCIMNRLSKNSLYVKMDYVGKLIEIVNSKMLSDVILKDTSSITGETASVTKMQIKNSINDKALKSMVEMFTYNLPGKQVATGDKWDITATINSGGMSLDIITSYNLDAIKDNAAIITAESNIKASENADPLEYSGAKITYDNIKGLGKSNMVMDIQTGLLLDNTSKIHIAGDLNVSAQGYNLQIPMEIDGESKVVALQ
jgi:hypothetical protein